MKTIKQLFLISILCLPFVFVSCDNDDEVKNKLVGTEWADNTGMWLWTFKSNTSLDVVYKIPNAPHALYFENLGYKLEGNNLQILDYETTSPHGGNFYVIKDFKGTVSGNKISCDFLTPTTEIEEGQTMPDLTKLVTVHVELQQK